MKRALVIRFLLLFAVGGCYAAAVAGSRTAGDSGLVVALVLGAAMMLALSGYLVWEARTLAATQMNTDHLALQLVSKEVALNRFATVDELTGLYTRREFEQFVKIEFERHRRHQHPATILLVEIDGIAEFAARIGALNKDLLIAELSAVLKRILRSIDLGCRYAGDTLAVLLLETTLDQAIIVTERVREAVANCGYLRTAEGVAGWSVTQAIASFDPSESSGRAYLRAAEQALAEARALGSDQMQIAASHPGTGQDQAA